MRRTITYPNGITEVQEGTPEELAKMPPVALSPAIHFVPYTPAPVNPYPVNPYPTYIGDAFTFTTGDTLQLKLTGAPDANVTSVQDGPFVATHYPLIDRS